MRGLLNKWKMEYLCLSFDMDVQIVCIKLQSEKIK